MTDESTPPRLPETLFVGKNILYFNELDSTNKRAKLLLQNDRLPEGTVIRAGNQTQGRGQLGTSWESAPYQNLTVSYVIYPYFLAAVRQALLNYTVSLAIKDCLYRFEGIGDVKIKWPNDVYCDRRKIAGILISNQLLNQRIGTSILGIGLNINQTDFRTAPHATSLRAVTGRRYDLQTCLNHLSECLEKRYMNLRRCRPEALEEEYLYSLCAYRTAKHFRTAGGRMIEGMIVGLNRDGKLLVESEGGLKAFGLKDISYSC